MQVSSEDRSSHNLVQRDKKPWWLLLVALLIIALASYYLLVRNVEEQVLTPTTEVKPKVVEAPPVTPTIPELKPEPEKFEPQALEPELPKEPPLPSLTQSDEVVREQLSSLSEDLTFQAWLVPESLLQRFVAIVDGASRGAVMRKILPVEPLSKKFTADKSVDQYWLDKTSYSRYDAYVGLITSLDADLLVKLFHRFRPLLEEDYGELGYQPKQFGAALIAALDQVLATPEITYPVELVSKSVTYKFVRKDLEVLPDIQKQVLRTGPSNTRKIKAMCRSLRQKLLNP